MHRSTAAALALSGVLAIAGPAAAEGQLFLYNWSNTTPDALIERFEKETGIDVVLDSFDANETSLAKLKTGAASYDVVVVTSDFVPIFIKEGLLQPIDGPAMEGYANIEQRWQSPPWDPGNKYTLPFYWGMTGFAVDTARYNGPMDSMKVLFEPPAELKGKVGMFGSVSEVMAASYVYLGRPQCSSNPDDLRAAQALLEAQKPAVQVYSADGTIERMASGESAMHQMWSGAAFRARAQKDTVRFVYPKEGVITWMENFTIPATAKNVDNAKKFLAFMLRPENAATVVDFIRYPSAIQGSLDLVDKALLTAPEFAPPADAKLVFGIACDEQATRMYDRIWTRLKS